MATAITFARDRRLVEWYQTGEGADAFVELYRLHYARLVRFCRRSLGSDAHLAEDIAQDAFVRALAGLDSLGGERRFYPWLVVIARRLILMHFRRAWRRAAAYERAGVLASSVVASPEEATVDWLTDAAARTRATQALDRVPARYREVIQLRVWEELSYADIAARMQITPTTVAPLLHRARVALRQEFNALAPREPMAALVGFTSTLWAALRRGRDRAAQWATALPDVGVIGIPVSVGLVSLGALLGAGLLATGTIPSSNPRLGLDAPAHSAADSADSGAAVNPKTHQASPSSVRIPSSTTKVGQGIFHDNDLRNGLASIATSEAGDQDRERSRTMPHRQQIGPLWWSMDPDQAQQTINDIALAQGNGTH